MCCLVLQCKLRTVVWWITEWETGGVPQPEEHCTETGYRVMDLMCTKHLNARLPQAASIETYKGRPPEIVPVEITEDTVTEVVGHLSGGAGPGGETR